jgi:alpha-1,2-mannosyltransferase
MTCARSHTAQIQPTTVYPPCDTSTLQALPLRQSPDARPVAGLAVDTTTIPACGRSNYIISVAQFRPEKDHALQLLAFQKLVAQATSRSAASKARLVLVGGVRNSEDAERVEDLRRQAESLGIQVRTASG